MVAAAADLWHRRSYTDVGVSEICEVARVQKGSFYHFFPSKQHLALAVIDDRWDELGARRMHDLMTSDLPPLERIIRFLEHGLAAQVECKCTTGVTPGCMFGNLAVELSCTDEVPRVRLQRLFGDWADLLRIAIDGAVSAGEIPPTDTDRAARALLAYVEGLSVLVKTADDPGVAADLIPMALRLIGADPGTLTPLLMSNERTTG
jgi:TetR/AcrR family transcriptional repressor of nem operon